MSTVHRLAATPETVHWGHGWRWEHDVEIDAVADSP